MALPFIDGNKAVFGHELIILFVWISVGSFTEVCLCYGDPGSWRRSMLLFLFIALGAPLKPLKVLLNFSAFEAVEKPNYLQRKAWVTLSREMTEPLQCSLI